MSSRNQELLEIKMRSQKSKNPTKKMENKWGKSPERDKKKQLQ